MRGPPTLSAVLQRTSPSITTTRGHRPSPSHLSALRGPLLPTHPCCPRRHRPSDRHLIHTVLQVRSKPGARDSLVQGTLPRRTSGRKRTTDSTVPRQPCLRRPFSCGPAPTLLPPAHVGHPPSPETEFHSNPPRTPQGYQSRRCSRASLR